jgi:oxygen-independent coproporphyrinogen-3 oxidase
VAFDAIERAHAIRMDEYFAHELAELRAMRESGLVELAPRAIQVTAAGWYVVRAIAMLFDRHLQQDRLARERYSRVI